MSQLTWNRHGKSRIRLVKVVRGREPGAIDPAPVPDRVVDLTLDVQIEGAFDPVYVAGDNTGCLATDTMKNTVYAFARRESIEQVEVFLLKVAEHFGAQPLVSRVRITAAEQPWSPLAVGGTPHPHAFVHAGAEQWTAMVIRDAGGPSVTSGVTNLVVLKTTDSGFSGFPRDEYTTLPETEDRILATSVTARWTYRPGTSDFAVRTRVRTALVETFAAHQSRSVQHTLYAMAEAALAAAGDIVDITLTMPNRHHLLVDLTPFGLDNPNQVFVATDQPFGLIEATIRR